MEDMERMDLADVVSALAATRVACTNAMAEAMAASFSLRSRLAEAEEATRVMERNSGGSDGQD